MFDKVFGRTGRSNATWFHSISLISFTLTCYHFLPPRLNAYIECLWKHFLLLSSYKDKQILIDTRKCDRQIVLAYSVPFSWSCLAELNDRTNVRANEPASSNRNAAHSQHITPRSFLSPIDTKDSTSNPP